MVKKGTSLSRLEEALEERDRALEQLAYARAELDALKLKERWPDEKPPPLYPSSAAPDLAPPLRYVLVDEVSARLKKMVGPVYGLLRRALVKAR